MIKYLDKKGFQKKYGTNLLCRKALLNHRISADGLCFNPKCDAEIEWYYTPLNDRNCLLCRKCLTHIHPTVDSIFEHSKVELKDWFEIIWRILSSRGGISANYIHREFGYSYPTSLYLLHDIRKQMYNCLQFEMDNTVVEVDESYISTGTKGLGRHHHFSRGRGSLRHTSILAIIERKGKAKLFVIPATDAESILPKITENIPLTISIFTDDWGAYNQLKELGYEHAAVNHSIEYVAKETGASTNSAENMFSTFKTMVIKGTYRSVSDKFLQHYCNEQAFRHTYRFEEDYGMEAFLKSFSCLSDSYGVKKKLAA